MPFGLPLVEQVAAERAEWASNHMNKLYAIGRLMHADGKRTMQSSASVESCFPVSVWLSLSYIIVHWRGERRQRKGRGRERERERRNKDRDWLAK